MAQQLTESEQINNDNLDETLIGPLKQLLGSLTKLQQARSETGEIKPSLIKLLDGEFLEEDELEKVSQGLKSLAKLAKAHADYQIALKTAQPAREYLDTVLKH